MILKLTRTQPKSQIEETPDAKIKRLEAENLMLMEAVAELYEMIMI
jgi:hypothetical protein